MMKILKSFMPRYTNSHISLMRGIDRREKKQSNDEETIEKYTRIGGTFLPKGRSLRGVEKRPGRPCFCELFLLTSAAFPVRSSFVASQSL